jgi:alkanesulfonate monooxygenase SsuD/methylene tetrahydromethanopterin reductase-like flavin-dependent oxidoreductase (luciferase family)
LKTSLFYLPSIGSRAEMERGLAGLRGDLYDRMLHELTEQAQLADDLGYDSISFTEHHFHVEGFEISNNPILLDLYVAMQTKRIRVGQLGIVLPANNPIRVAEDIAMLDRMTGGRACAGFTTRSTPRIARPSRSATASSRRPGPRTCSRTRASTGAFPPGRPRGSSRPPAAGAPASRTAR